MFGRRESQFRGGLHIAEQVIMMSVNCFPFSPSGRLQYAWLQIVGNRAGHDFCCEGDTTCAICVFWAGCVWLCQQSHLDMMLMRPMLWLNFSSSACCGLPGLCAPVCVCAYMCTYIHVMQFLRWHSALWRSSCCFIFSLCSTSCHSQK